MDNDELEERGDDGIQHGLDDNAENDDEKGAVLGGVGGAAVGAAAGSLAGPAGAAFGAVIGGLAGALASGSAVAALDEVDNDDTVIGVGHGVTRDEGAAVVPSGQERGDPGGGPADESQKERGEVDGPACALDLDANASEADPAAEAVEPDAALAIGARRRIDAHSSEKAPESAPQEKSA